MPELPDIELYLHALRSRLVDEKVAKVHVPSPFVVRSFEPPIRELEGRTILGFRRLGKRVVFELDDALFLVIHLMIAGRFRWFEGVRKRGKGPRRKYDLFEIDTADATLVLTEAGSKRRASLYLVRGEEALAEHDPGGIDVLDCSLAAFHEALVRENHTLKRTLTDPHVYSGIGNAYSDEILHDAQLSPVKWTTRLSDEEVARLHTSTQAVMKLWKEKLIAETGDSFPEKVSAFRAGMAVHGRYKHPCPRCEAPVQRIVRGKSEVNYCPACQTGGKLLADRALSRLLRGDWPKTLDALEERKVRNKQ